MLMRLENSQDSMVSITHRDFHEEEEDRTAPEYEVASNDGTLRRTVPPPTSSEGHLLDGYVILKPDGTTEKGTYAA